MINTKYFSMMIVLGFSLSACNNTETSISSSTNSSSHVREFTNFKLHLIDAPADEVKEVHVNVSQIEVWFKLNNQEGRLVLAKNLGDVDLLKLQNGTSLGLADIDLPSGIELNAIRLLLNRDNNYIITADGTRTELQTPSAQQSGIKIPLHGVKLDGKFDYELTVDFDAKKSLVFQGNGDCLLKPVLKIPKFHKKHHDDELCENKYLSQKSKSQEQKHKNYHFAETSRHHSRHHYESCSLENEEPTSDDEEVETVETDSEVENNNDDSSVVTEEPSVIDNEQVVADDTQSEVSVIEQELTNDTTTNDGYDTTPVESLPNDFSADDLAFYNVQQ